MPYDEIELMDSIEHIDDRQWNNLIERSSLGTIFHRTEWLMALEKGWGLEARHFIAYSNNNIVAIFPNFLKQIRNNPLKRLISLPTGYGGPIIPSNWEVIFDSFLNRSAKICRGRTISHVISFPSSGYVGYWGMLRSKGYDPIYRCNFYHDLSKGIEYNYMNLNKSKKKVLKNYYGKYTYEVENLNNENLGLFYGSYQKLMNELKANIYPFEFFEALIEYCQDIVLLITQYSDGIYVGGKLIVVDNKNNTLHSFLSGVEKKQLIEHSSFLLIWNALEWGIENKFDLYDLGPSLDDFRNGIFKFKNEIGGEIEPNISWERSFYPMKPFYNLAKRFISV